MPIIRESRFKTALVQALDSKTGNFVKAPTSRYSLALTKYYSAQLEAADGDLSTLKNNLPARVGVALKPKKRHVLLGTLASALDYYAWKYHEALDSDEATPPTDQDIAALQNGAHNASIAKHGIDTATTNFVNYLTSILQHVEADWDELNSVFFPELELLRLKRVKFFGSDSHKGGKSVALLTFTAQTAEPVGRLRRRPKSYVKLIYKPSDLTLDYLFVGATRAIVNQIGNQGLPTQMSLFERINEGILNGQPRPIGFPNPKFNDGYHTGDPQPIEDFQLPTYKLLPRNPGDVAGAYGYIEFLHHAPEPDTDLARIVVDGEYEDWDWVTDQRGDLMRYYRTLGWYIAVAMLFGMADVHEENLIVHKKRPYLIDLEISFKWKTDALAQTLMTRMFNSPGPEDGDKCQIFYWDGALRHTRGTMAKKWMRRAFKEAWAYLVADPGNRLRNWLAGVDLGGALARYTPQATMAYGVNLRTVYINALEPVPPPFVADNGFQDHGSIKAWYNGGENYHRPNYAMRCQAHDWTDYLNCDYPSYYRVLNSRDLLNARGQVVAVANPRLAFNHADISANRTRTIAGTSYFDHYPAVFLFSVDLTTTPAAGDPAHLDGNLVADLTASFANAVPAINLTGAAVATTENAGSGWRIIDGNRIFHITLIQGTTTVEVYEAGSAIAMVQSFQERVRGDVAYRNSVAVRALNDIDGLFAGVNGAFDAF